MLEQLFVNIIRAFLSKNPSVLAKIPNYILKTLGISRFCFTEGTLIATSSGEKAIEKIKIGDLVYSENPETVMPCSLLIEFESYFC